MAAADSGCNVLETSTHAHTLPAWVIPAINVSASEVRPEHSGPTISLMAPTGNPPWSRSINLANAGRSNRVGNSRHAE